MYICVLKQREAPIFITVHNISKNVIYGMGGRQVVKFQSFTGRVTMINDAGAGGNHDGCYTLIAISSVEGQIVNFVAGPDTYFVDHKMIRIGDRITGFYDADQPTPLIYPPQYRAVVIAVTSPSNFVKVDYFNEKLVSSDGQLKLNISPATAVLLENGQQFTGNLTNRYLIVSYRASTKSIPAQTTPTQIVVMC